MADTPDAPSPSTPAFTDIVPAPTPAGQPEDDTARPDLPIPGLPAMFPKKRRGRPPGRPNMTVRETDYEDNALVQAWNAAKTWNLARPERTLTVVPIRIREALNESAIVHESQRPIFHMPGREILYYVQGWITARHVASKRPSYVNGLLIHSRGQDAPTSCTQCVERRDKDALGPFITCRTLQGVFHNSCSNCKWFDNTSTCSLYTGPKPNRKRKAKELAPAAAQPNGTEPTAVPNTEPVVIEDTAQTPPDLADLAGPSAPENGNQANQNQQEVVMGGTTDAQPSQPQGNNEAPQAPSVSDEPVERGPGDGDDEYV